MEAGVDGGLKSTPLAFFNSNRGSRNFRGGFNPPTPSSNTALVLGRIAARSVECGLLLKTSRRTVVCLSVCWLLA